MNWSELHEKFRRLCEKTGASKATSYALDVSFDPPTGKVSVHLGTYDIGDWPRHTYLGPFDTEEEAQGATEAKIIEAERLVASEMTPNAELNGPRMASDLSAELGAGG